RDTLEWRLSAGAAAKVPPAALRLFDSTQGFLTVICPWSIESVRRLACGVSIALVTLAGGASGASAAALEEGIARLRGTPVKNEAGAITEINLDSSPATLDDVKLLAGEKNLTKLTLWGAAINDESLALVVKLPKLTDLLLLETRVSDDGLKLLAQAK